MAEDVLQPLSLRSNNPYSTGYVLILPDGSVTLEREKIVHSRTIRDRYFTVTQGDTISSIAYEAYGDAKLWWIIADANSLDTVFELEVGSSLLIPDYSRITYANG